MALASNRVRKWGRASACSAGAALALTACAGVPELAAKPTPLASLSNDQTFAAPDRAWPGDSWWRAYEDPQLDALIEEGLAKAPSLEEAQARVRAGDAQRRALEASDGPALSFEGAAAETKQSYRAGIPAPFVPHGYRDYGQDALNFSYIFDFWGRNRAAVAAAASQERASEAEAAQARLVLSTSIAAAYADLARLYRERDIAAQALEVRTKTADLIARRVQNGLDNQGAQRLAEAGPPAARAQLAAIDEALTQTRNALAALLGAGPDRGLTIARPTGVALASFGLPAHLAADLLGRRPDIVAARWRAQAASQGVREAKAAFYPNIDLAAFLGVQSLGLANLTQTGADIGSLGAALHLPIFDAGSLRAHLARADAERDEAVASYDATLDQALREIGDVVASERFLSTRLSETQSALDADEDAFRIARTRYEGGLSNYLSVLVAEDAVLAQRLVVADLESRKFALDVALVRALGGGFSTH